MNSDNTEGAKIEVSTRDSASSVIQESNVRMISL